MSRGALYTFQPTIADTSLRNCWYLNLCLSFDSLFVFVLIIYERGQFTCPAHLLETRLPHTPFQILTDSPPRYKLSNTVLICILKAAAHPKSWQRCELV